MTVRVGVIGLGTIGNLHADIYKETPRAQLIGVCDIDKQRADAASQRLLAAAIESIQGEKVVYVDQITG